MITQSIYLLATGPLSAGMIEQAAASDIIVDVLSFIVTERVVVGGLRELAVQPLAVVFTSVNAVESVKEGLHGRVPGWKVYCISGATRQAVTDYFGAAAVEGTAESAGLLVELICRGEEAREISFFCGDHRREELPYHNSENENLNEWNKVDGSRSSRVKFTKPVCDKIRSSVNKSFPMSRVCDPDLLSSIVNEFRMPYGIRSRESIVDTEGSDKPLAWECPLG